MIKSECLLFTNQNIIFIVQIDYIRIKKMHIGWHFAGYIIEPLGGDK